MLQPSSLVAEKQLKNHVPGVSPKVTPEVTFDPPEDTFQSVLGGSKSHFWGHFEGRAPENRCFVAFQLVEISGRFGGFQLVPTIPTNPEK